MHLSLVMVAAVLAGGWPPAHAQSVRVTLLGTGTPPPALERMGPATLIEAGDEKLLFDVGRGTTIRLTEAGVDPSSLTAVFITHFHSDHVVGLPDLWLLGHVGPFYRGEHLDLFGPPGTQSLARGLSVAFAKDIELRARPDRPGPELRPSEFQGAGLVLERNGVKVTAVPVDHVRDSYGYRIDYKGRSVVISGDARPSEALVTAATDSDLLVHEIMAIGEDLLRSRPPAAQSMMRAVLSTHTTPLQAAKILRQATPRATVFNHVSLNGVSEEQVLSEIRSTYEGLVEMGEDLMTITIGEKITITRR